MLFNYIVYTTNLFTQEAKQLEFFIGMVKLSGQTDWCTLDSAICQAFKVSCMARAIYSSKVFIIFNMEPCNILVSTKVYFLCYKDILMTILG